MTNPLHEVQALGQSIWYDNISRELLQNGEIQKLIDEDGITGITSNPTIIMQAITGSSVYDTAIATMLDHDPQEIYERLVIEDIRTAADLLLPIYQRTNKQDGYVSLEIAPHLADDTEGTIHEAKRLFELLDRPNVMLKVPGTPAGLAAVEELIFAGVNINVTLVFAVATYQAVAEHYIRGLERRQAADLDITSVASVSSFFISRIDARIDQHLQNNIRSAQGRDLERVRINRKLLGKIAISNAQVAYQAFKQVFLGERFAALAEAGAMVQRPLWASTGTKNPSYPDTLYVERLIGPHSVSTLPPETLKAFKQHGKAALKIEKHIKKAHKRLARLGEDAGIELADITHMLQVDGLDIFADSYEKLLTAIEGKREMLKAGVIARQRGIVGGYEPGVRRTVARLDAEKANRAIWRKDPTFWKSEAFHHDLIRNRLGWLHCIQDGSIDRARLAALQAEAGQWAHVVVLGMGGSSLAADVFRTTFGHMDGYPELLILDSTVPAYIHSIEQQIDFAKTLFIVASQTGTTLETESLRRYFFQRVLDEIGRRQAGQHFIAITNPDTPLAAIAAEDGYRDLFLNPADIGGRYAALTYLGLVPAAVMGVDLARIFANAETMLQAVGEIIPAQGHPGIWLGALLGYLAEAGHDKLGLLFSKPIAGFAHWVEQLIAESTGKDGRGILPVVAATVGKPHDYDDDRFLIYLRLDGESEAFDNQVRQLWEAGLPVFTINLRDPYDLGGEFLRWEFATAIAAHLMHVNPFDEPNVIDSKNTTNQLLEYYESYGNLPPETPFLEEDNVALYVDPNTGDMLENICAQRNYSNKELAGLLAAHISFARSGDYIALMAYLEPSAENNALLADIRRRLRHSTTRAVTLGYGPRYLHATGQLHKGGSPDGIFLQITVDDPLDIDIPDSPFSFSILKQAQARGDQNALMQRERPFVRLHIKGDIPAGLSKILQAVAVAEEKQF